MGLLDDAIREHLDLKRRRGADPTEVERQESEALGPVPRGEGGRALPPEEPAEEAPFLDDEPPAPAPLAAEPAAAASPPAAPPTPPQQDEVEYEIDLPEDDDPFVPMDEPVADAPLPPSPSAADDQATSAYSLDDLAALDDRPRAAPPAEPPTAPPGSVAPRDVVPADDEPGEHDVLEETPDFLEETPEHDRLWFEQKPPRDFDF